MICDFDDFSISENRLDLLLQLKDANPKFKCTLFAIPGQGSDAFWDEVPLWCELAVHGWMHPSSTECAKWTYERTEQMIAEKPLRFVRGFKAPGWQVSDQTYMALRDYGWWIADHWENNPRRPDSLASHVVTPEAAVGRSDDHWHGHIPDVCGNGIAQTFDALREKVTAAESFEFVSEVVA